MSAWLAVVILFLVPVGAALHAWEVTEEWRKK